MSLFSLSSVKDIISCSEGGGRYVLAEIKKTERVLWEERKKKERKKERKGLNGIVSVSHLIFCLEEYSNVKVLYTAQEVCEI